MSLGEIALCFVCGIIGCILFTLVGEMTGWWWTPFE